MVKTIIVKFALMTFILCLAIGAFGTLQFWDASPASAGSVPPPDDCTTEQGGYVFGNPDCWGTAGNPPAGCVNGNSVGTTADCLAWKAKLPIVDTTTDNCPSGDIVGPQQVCCLPTDKVCLAGSVGPQGDAIAIVYAKEVCSVAQAGIGPSVLPYGCTTDPPTLAAAAAVCNFIFQSAENVIGAVSGSSNNIGSPTDPDIFDSDQPGVVTCRAFLLSAAGEYPPTNAPQSGDFDTAKEVCGDLIKYKSELNPNAIPANCSGSSPNPQDGVMACKTLILANLPDDNGIKSKCLDLMSRNPASTAVPPIQEQPQAVQFHDANLKKLVEGESFLILALCIGGIFYSMILWVMGSKGNNEGQHHAGKRGVIVCLVAAFILGALPQIFTYLSDTSHEVDDNQVTAAN